MATLLVIPFLTRAFTPEDLGQWEILILSIVIISNLAPIRYENGIVVTKDDQYHALTNLCFFIAFPVSLLLSAIAYFVGKVHFDFLTVSYFDLRSYHQS